jgi:hypothetical protein
MKTPPNIILVSLNRFYKLEFPNSFGKKFEKVFYADFLLQHYCMDNLRCALRYNLGKNKEKDCLYLMLIVT